MKIKITPFFLVIVSSFLFIACGSGGKNPEFLNEELIITPLKSGLNNAIIKSASRGDVRAEVYLPPAWNKNATITYPVIFFLHGQGESQKDFFNVVESTQIDA